jgi:hypothetical protein
MSKGRVENYSYLSVKQLALKGRFSPAYLEENKEVSISISCLYGGYNIRLSHTPCNYGGVRFWLLCPSPGCSKLYFKNASLACRDCHKLNYTSQQWNKSDIPLLRVLRVRNRLGWSHDLMTTPLHKKPKNMQYKTFKGLVDLHERLNQERLLAFIGLIKTTSLGRFFSDI